MADQPAPPAENRRQQIIQAARREQEEREQTYRGRALKLFAHVCARCGREFSGKRLRELTVHHKDHDHDNNPPDGSNWELLCLYCHDNEHSRLATADAYGSARSETADSADFGHKPFSKLAALLKQEKK
jgi:5-methylcytosine-specific restriction endonuclease McrA